LGNFLVLLFHQEILRPSFCDITRQDHEPRNAIPASRFKHQR
jgi:hypothetical protein